MRSFLLSINKDPWLPPPAHGSFSTSIMAGIAELWELPRPLDLSELRRGRDDKRTPSWGALCLWIQIY